MHFRSLSNQLKKKNFKSYIKNIKRKNEHFFHKIEQITQQKVFKQKQIKIKSHNFELS